MPFEEAIGYVLNKEPNPEEWDSAMWAAEKPAVRVRSFFSSRVENARFLDRAQGLIFDYMAKVTDEVTGPDGVKRPALRIGGRADFVRLMREFMVKEGMATPEELWNTEQSDLTDIKSEARLRLIFDTTVRQAYGYGNWRQGMTPAVRRAFPAARLVRVRDVAIPRPRHAAHEGEVRLKTDIPWWARYQNDPQIGGFGVPWGPYGFRSGVDQEDVPLREWETLTGRKFDTGAEEMKETDLPGMNDGLGASTKGMDPEIKRKLIEELQALNARDAKRLERSIENSAREAAERARNRALERRGIKPPEAPKITVVDEGDKIRIGEDVGERISKTRKREGMATPEQEKAIAEKVFQSIDRKAAEPQTQPTGGKGINRERHLSASELTLTPEERQMLESPHEILAVYTAEGRLKKAVLGDRQTVGIPGELPPGAILTHNHPTGRGPSDSDLKAVLTRPGTTLRVVATNENGKAEVFQLKALKQVSSEQIAEIAVMYRDLAQMGGDTPSGRRAALDLISEEFGGIIQIERAETR